MKTKQFTKEDRCTKIEVWNCFFGEGSHGWPDGLRSSDITRAKAIIGRNVPRVLIEARRAEMVTYRGEQHIKLTKIGQQWLEIGTLRYVTNQPEKFGELENPRIRWKRNFLKTVAKS